jgi:hypothetical protein
VAAYHVTNNFSRMYVTTGLGLFWLTLGLIAAVVERHRPRPTPADKARMRLTKAGRG